jgi:outer membrane protein
LNKSLQFVLAAGLVLFALNAGADPKVGYVEVDRILREAPQAIESAKKLQKEFSPRTAELERLQKQLQDKENSGTAKEQELSNLRVDFERKRRELNEDINIRKGEELSALQDRINKAVTAVSEAEGFDMVLYSGTVYVSKRANFTDKVLKSLGKTTP